MESSLENLLKKYAKAAPRYTSYPTVPYWENKDITWKNKQEKMLANYDANEGISLYIHLPFCESLCTYCGCNTRITKNHQVEKPYIETLIKEWKIYQNWIPSIKLKEIHLGGGTPTFFSAENLVYLIETIKQDAVVDSDFEFSFEGHPANTTSKQLEKLYQLGFKRISLGIQDFDPKVQEVINRKQSFEQVRSVTQTARDIGYLGINYDLIYGLPFQTEEGVQKTVEKVTELNPDRIAYYAYAHVPWLKPGQRKYDENDLPKGKEKLRLYEIGKKLFLKNGFVEIGMDHFAKPTDDLKLAFNNGTLNRNFMGYTTTQSKVVIGLGASAISDTWEMFYQNPKKVEDYIRFINENLKIELKGHVLNSEDLVLREHIKNLMCNYKSSWKDSNGYIPFIKEAIKLLQPFMDDKLVEVDHTSIRILDEGKPLLRLICACFDARMNKKINTENTFSAAI